VPNLFTAPWLPLKKAGEKARSPVGWQTEGTRGRKPESPPSTGSGRWKWAGMAGGGSRCLLANSITITCANCTLNASELAKPAFQPSIRPSVCRCPHNCVSHFYGISFGTTYNYINLQTWCPCQDSGGLPELPARDYSGSRIVIARLPRLPSHRHRCCRNSKWR